MFLVRDLLDRGAATRRSERPLVEALAIAGPVALVAFNTALGTLTELLERVPALALLSEAVLTIVCMVAVLYVIMSRDNVPRTLHVIGGEPDRATYRFGRMARLAAKLALVPLACFVGWALWCIVPNGIAGRHGLGGFVASHPISPGRLQGTVDVLDSTGRSVAEAPSVIGTSGFFYVALRAEATRPRAIRIRSPECGDTLIEISESSGRSRQRETVEQTKDPVDWPEWLVWCGKPAPDGPAAQ
jgi:hypothetical protein